MYNGIHWTCTWHGIFWTIVKRSLKRFFFLFFFGSSSIIHTFWKCSTCTHSVDANKFARTSFFSSCHAIWINAEYCLFVYLHVITWNEEDKRKNKIHPKFIQSNTEFIFWIYVQIQCREPSYNSSDMQMKRKLINMNVKYVCLHSNLNWFRLRYCVLIFLSLFHRLLLVIIYVEPHNN